MTEEGLIARVRTITSDIAERWWERYLALQRVDPERRNRPLSDDRVVLYAGDIKEGRWHLNGETIKLATDGWIIDGQHRLAACIKSKASFRSLVVENVDNESFKSIDIGKGRTLSALLAIQGYKSSTDLTAATSNVWRWEQGGNREFAQWGRSPSKAEAHEVLARHPRLPEYVAKKHTALRYLMAPGLAVALDYILSEKDPALGEQFFGGLCTGVGLQPDDPVYALRERLLRDRQLKPRPPALVVAELVLRAWGAKGDHAEAKALQDLHLRRAGGEMTSSIEKRKHEFAPTFVGGWPPAAYEANPCKLCGRLEGHPVHPFRLVNVLRTAEGKLVQEPAFHWGIEGGQQPPCPGDRAEKSLWFEGWWWWVCLTCGAIWLGMMSPARYLRDLWRGQAGHEGQPQEPQDRAGGPRQ